MLGRRDQQRRAAPPVPDTVVGHGLLCRPPGPVARLDVVSRRQRELGSIPERRVVARVVVGVAHVDVERDAGEELAQGRPGLAEGSPDQVRELDVCRVAPRQLVQLEQGEGGDHDAALVGPGTVEPLDEQHVEVGNTGDVDAGHVQPDATGELHGHALRLHDRELVARRLQLGDQRPLAVSEEDLGAGAADRAGVLERAADRLGQLDTPLHRLGTFDQLVERGRLVARHVLIGPLLEVEPADPVGAGLQQVGDRVQVGGVGRTDPGAQTAVEDDSLSPRIGTGVVDAPGDAQAVERGDRLRDQWQLRRVQGDRVIPGEVAASVAEPHGRALQPHDARGDGIGGPGQPRPHVGLGRLRAGLRRPRSRHWAPGSALP